MVMSSRTSRVPWVLPAALLWFVTNLPAIQMARIALLNEHLGGNYPCGDARHCGRNAVYGENYNITPDSVIGYEYEGNNQFQRVVAGGLSFEGVWAFGDGDGDSLMELVAPGRDGGASVVILESRTDTSYPVDSVWGACPEPASNNPYPRYMDLDRDGHQELARLVEWYGIFLYENTGNNQYSLAAVLADTYPFSGPDGDFDVGDLDRDGLMELVTGSGYYYFYVYKATGQNNQYVLACRCSTEASAIYNVAVANDMDHNGLPEVLVIGTWVSGGQQYLKLMIDEAVAGGGFHRVWELAHPDWYQGWFGNPISVGSVDGDSAEEFAVNTGAGTIALFKCTGLHSYTQVWTFNTTGTFFRLFDINRDGRAECIFDSDSGTEIWEDTEGLGVAEFSKFPLESQVMATPSVARLGASLQFSGIPADAEVDVLALDGELVRRTQGVRQSTWTWNFRDQSGNLVPAGTYFAVIRSKGKTTSLKLCLVK